MLVAWCEPLLMKSDNISPTDLFFGQNFVKLFWEKATRVLKNKSKNTWILKSSLNKKTLKYK